MGSDQPPGQKPPAAPASQNKPPQPARPPGAPPPRQASAPTGAPKPLPRRRPDAEPRSRTSELMMMPLVFFSFMFGLVNMIAVPAIYVYEIIAYNKKDQWPGWSGLDALNYLFYEKRPLFFRSDMLFRTAPPTQIIDLHIPAVTKFINQVVVGYLDMSIVFICFLQGVVFMSLAVRVSIRVLDKPK